MRNICDARLSRKVFAQLRVDAASSIRAGVKVENIIIEACDKAQSKLHLPFSETELIEGIDAYGANADDLHKFLYLKCHLMIHCMSDAIEIA